MRMPEYVRLIGQEWSKQGAQQGGKDVARQLQMTVAESMWRLTEVRGERGDIGYEGLRGGNGFIWRAQGRAASVNMWVDRLEQEDIHEKRWCTIEAGDLVVRQEDTGIAWILLYVRRD